MKIKVGVSKRHVHLTKEVYEELFGNQKLEVRNYLNQPGEFASTSAVDLKWNDKVLSHVRVVGPLRIYNQIEISATDADVFGVKPPRRQSGELNESLPITIIGPNAEITLNEGLILAERHIHMNKETAIKLDLVNKECVEVFKDGKYIFNSIIKIKEPAFIEMHIDTDEEKMYNLHTEDVVEFKKCGK